MASKTRTKASILAQTAQCSGHLNKRGVTNTSWKRRFFVLSQNVLYYYKSNKDTEPVGTVVVPSYVVAKCDTEGKKFAFQLSHTNCRTFLMYADTQEDMDMWMKALTAAALFLADPAKPTPTAPAPTQTEEQPTIHVEEPNDGDIEADVAVMRNVVSGWISGQLAQINLTFDDLTEDLRDGVLLVNLLEMVTDSTVATFHENAIDTASRVENVEAALKLADTMNVPRRDGVTAQAIEAGTCDEVALLIYLWGIVRVAKAREATPRKTGLKLTTPRRDSRHHHLGTPGDRVSARLSYYRHDFTEDPATLEVPTLAATAPVKSRTDSESVGTGPVQLPYRIAIVGTACGKTSLLARFVKGSTGVLRPTTAEELVNHTILVDTHRANLTVSDLPSSGDQEGTRVKAYARVDAAIICFSVTKRESFEEVTRIVDRILEARIGGIPIVLAATMVDQKADRAVLAAEARAVAELNGMPMVETSALEGIRINDAFVWAVRLINRKRGIVWTESPIHLETAPEKGLVMMDSETVKYRAKRDNAFPELASGSMEKIVEAMANPSYFDMDFVTAMLRTHRFFSNSAELLELLLTRYKMKPSMEGMNDKRLERYLKEVSIPTRVRVLRVIDEWIQNFPDDFRGNEEGLLTPLRLFLTSDVDADMRRLSGRIHDRLTQLANEDEDDDDAASVDSDMADPQNPDTEEEIGWGTVDFSDMDVVLAAQQITLIDMRLFKKIQPKECLSNAWVKKDKDEKAPNIVKATRRFNAVSTWATTEIVKRFKMADRVAILKKYLDLAEKLHRYGNYNGTMAILSALTSQPVHRLKRTWEAVGPTYRDMYLRLKDFMSVREQFKQLRAAMRQATGPIVPFMGMYLTDLTFFFEANKNLDGTLINVLKWRALADVTLQIQRFQARSYEFPKNPRFYAYLRRADGVATDAAHQLSLNIEPPSKSNRREEAEVSVDVQINALLRSAFPAMREYMDALKAKLRASAGGDPLPMPDALSEDLQSLAKLYGPAMSDDSIAELANQLETTYRTRSLSPPLEASAAARSDESAATRTDETVTESRLSTETQSSELDSRRGSNDDKQPRRPVRGMHSSASPSPLGSPRTSNAPLPDDDLRTPPAKLPRKDSRAPPVEGGLLDMPPTAGATPGGTPPARPRRESRPAPVELLKEGDGIARSDSSAGRAKPAIPPRSNSGRLLPGLNK